MPAYSQLKKSAGTGTCPVCSTVNVFLYLFSQQGGIVARSGRPTDGSFAKEERELSKPVEWSKQPFCSFPCFLRGLPTPKAQVWILKRRMEGAKPSREVSRHITPTSAAKALAATIALSSAEFYIEEPEGRI